MPNDVMNPVRQQPKGQDDTIDPSSVPEGGLLPFKTPVDDGGNPIGTLPGGEGNKPFKLDGGG